MTVVLNEVLSAPRTVWRAFADWLHARMPRGLYARALLILILPVVLLQSAVAYFFMERHWEVVTYRLSAGMARQVAALVDIYKTFPDDAEHTQLRRIANNSMTVNNNAVADGMSLANRGKGSMKLLVTGNTINYAGTQNAISVAAGQDGTNGTADLTITGNMINNSHDGVTDPLAGIVVNSGVASPSGDGMAMCVDIGGAGALKNVMTRTAGFCSLNTSPHPVIVPPVPTPATKASSRPSSAVQISRAVVARCIAGLAGLEN